MQKVWKTQNELEAHLLEHSTNKSYVCKNCQKVCATWDELEMHISEHTTDGDWNCDDCPHQTNTLDNLKKHPKRTHHKSKHVAAPTNQTFSCNLCMQKFPTTVTWRSTDSRLINPLNPVATSLTVHMQTTVSSITMKLTRICFCAMSVGMNSRS